LGTHGKEDGTSTDHQPSVPVSPPWQHAPLNGVLVFSPRLVSDKRGIFAKTFHSESFAQQGVRFALREEFYSISAKNVIRGMHFQSPPHDLGKLVMCLQGRLLDVVVDLRRSQPTFGRWWSIELSADNSRVLFVPSGLAHGFLSLADGSMTHYKTTAVHSPAHDQGIRWDSFGFTWPVSSPVLSERDMNLPRLDDFKSPFT